jgi:uncharacterized phage-associated protein
MTKEDFISWRNSPITIEIYKKLEETKQALIDNLAEGQTLCDSADATHGSTARIIGSINGLNQLLDISYEDETEEEAE